VGLGCPASASVEWTNPAGVGAAATAIRLRGYTVTPLWDPGFNQWGFWLFGVWIPL
jgi:hypothetical protein